MTDPLTIQLAQQTRPMLLPGQQDQDIAPQNRPLQTNKNKDSVLLLNSVDRHVFDFRNLIVKPLIELHSEYTETLVKLKMQEMKTGKIPTDEIDDFFKGVKEKATKIDEQINDKTQEKKSELLKLKDMKAISDAEYKEIIDKISKMEKAYPSLKGSIEDYYKKAPNSQLDKFREEDIEEILKNVDPAERDEARKKMHEKLKGKDPQLSVSRMAEVLSGKKPGEDKFEEKRKELSKLIREAYGGEIKEEDKEDAGLIFDAIGFRAFLNTHEKPEFYSGFKISKDDIVPHFLRNLDEHHTLALTGTNLVTYTKRIRNNAKLYRTIKGGEDVANGIKIGKEGKVVSEIVQVEQAGKELAQAKKLLSAEESVRRLSESKRIYSMGKNASIARNLNKIRLAQNAAKAGRVGRFGRAAGGPLTVALIGLDVGIKAYSASAYEEEVTRLEEIRKNASSLSKLEREDLEEAIKESKEQAVSERAKARTMLACSVGFAVAGAIIGSFIPIVGTGFGAAIGATIGGFVADWINGDLEINLKPVANFAKATWNVAKDVGSKIGNTVSRIWKGIFG